MNLPVDSSLRIPTFYLEKFTLDFSNGIAVPAKAGVRIFFPLSRYPNRHLVRIQVFGSKQIVPGGKTAFAFTSLVDIVLNVYDASGRLFIQNAPATRFLDADNTAPPSLTHPVPKRNLLFAPTRIDARRSYAMWTNPFLTPSNALVLGFVYK